jgi:hypothetical protein
VSRGVKLTFKGLKNPFIHSQFTIPKFLATRLFNLMNNTFEKKKFIPSRHKVGKIPFSIQSILSYNLKEYGSRNNHARRFTEIPAAVNGRSTAFGPAT